jgi:TPR repeat protein
MLYARGEGVEQDDEKAFSWWQQAAAQGLVLAQSRLGYCYFKGLGTSPDLGAASWWWAKAAAGGNAVAKRNLTILCRDYQQHCLADNLSN